MKTTYWLKRPLNGRLQETDSLLSFDHLTLELKITLSNEDENRMHLIMSKREAWDLVERLKDFLIGASEDKD